MSGPGTGSKSSLFDCLRRPYPTADDGCGAKARAMKDTIVQQLENSSITAKHHVVEWTESRAWRPSKPVTCGRRRWDEASAKIGSFSCRRALPVPTRPTV